MDKPTRYQCKALQGKSNYNICINSDMTVSCNCMDYFGRGTIGDLKKQSLKEIFSGPESRRLRKGLFEGKLPIPECRGCPERVEIDADADPEAILEGFTTPRAGIMFENTVLCNYKCVSCNRVDLMKTRGAKQMSLDDVRRVAGQIRENEIELLHFFNLGEPFLSKGILEELRILKGENPELEISTSTNGVLIDSDEKVEAALMMDHLFFSIDGSDQASAEKYQVGADFERAYANMSRVVEARNQRELRSTCIEWKYVVFTWNSDKRLIDQAIRLARRSGVDILSFWRGGGEGAYSPEQFEALDSLRGVGCRSWKGREIDFRSFDYTPIRQFLVSWGGDSDSSFSVKSLVDDHKALEELEQAIDGGEALSSRAFVERSYCAILEREADEDGLSFYTRQLDEGATKRTEFLGCLVSSDEFLACSPVA